MFRTILFLKLFGDCLNLLDSTGDGNPSMSLQSRIGFPVKSKGGIVCSSLVSPDPGKNNMRAIPNLFLQSTNICAYPHLCPMVEQIMVHSDHRRVGYPCKNRWWYREWPQRNSNSNGSMPQEPPTKPSYHLISSVPGDNDRIRRLKNGTHTLSCIQITKRLVTGERALPLPRCRPLIPMCVGRFFQGTLVMATPIMKKVPRIRTNYHSPHHRTPKKICAQATRPLHRTK